jgi:RHS repeat-associated protein
VVPGRRPAGAAERTPLHRCGHQSRLRPRRPARRRDRFERHDPLVSPRPARLDPDAHQQRRCDARHLHLQPLRDHHRTTGTVTPLLGYTGDYTDRETGFIYLRARHYDPKTGQFLSRDPLDAITGEPYGYTGGNPTNVTDPSGACPWCLAALGGAIIAGGLDLAIQGGTNLAKGCSFFDNINWTEVAVQAAIGAATGPAGKGLTLPRELTLGPNAGVGVDVYRGMSGGKPIYVGITNSLKRRAAAHGTRFDFLGQVTRSPVTRGEARAIEEALIKRNPGYQNINHSIDPSHPWYDDAVAWGEDWLTKNGY